LDYKFLKKIIAFLSYQLQLIPKNFFEWDFIVYCFELYRFDLRSGI